MEELDDSELRILHRRIGPLERDVASLKKETSFVLSKISKLVLSNQLSKSSHVAKSLKGVLRLPAPQSLLNNESGDVLPSAHKSNILASDAHQEANLGNGSIHQASTSKSAGTSTMRKGRSQFDFAQSFGDSDSDSDGGRKPDLKKKKRRLESRFSRLKRRIFGITPPDPATNQSGSRAIHPASPFMGVLESLCAIFLIYSVCIVPVQLSIWSNIGACEKTPTLEMDMFVDIIFMSEVVVRFFVGIEVHGKYYDGFMSIALKYLSAPFGFWFDAITSTPLSWVEFDFYQKCLTSGGNGGLGQNANFIRMVKTVRILKLTRLLKVFKFFTVVEERLDLSPGTTRLMKVFTALAAAIHIYSCTFWRVKIDSCSEESVLGWLESRAADPEDDIQIYIACLYFICTVFPTVGLGDISATNNAERVIIFAIFMLFTAASFFALTLSELQQLYQSRSASSRDMIIYLDTLISFLKDNRVQPKLEKEIKNWVRFQYVQQTADARSQKILYNLPPILRQKLAFEINQGLFAKIPFWSRISNSGRLKDRFTAELLLRMHTTFYTAGSCIARKEDEATGIRIILSGRVRILLPGRTVLLQTVGPGHSMGDTSILGDPRWAGMYGVEADFVAETNCKTCIILVDDFKDLIYASPAFIMIRSLCKRFKYEEASDEDFGRKTSRHCMVGESVSGRAERHQLELRASWCTFHWIRLARCLLHYLRVRSGAAAGWSADWTAECKQVPLNVPSGELFN